MKLKNLPPIYYINLDSDTERNLSIQSEFKNHGIKNYTRISAFDGRDSDLGEYIYGAYPGHDISSSEVGCTISHLYTLSHWLNSSDSECAIICEDDLDLSLSQYWSFNWEDFFNNLPDDWDCIQLAVINNHPSHIIMNLHPRQWWDWSTSCYMISRKFAQTLVSKYCKREKYFLSSYSEKPVADSVVYLEGKTYSINLFSYKTEFKSNIHQLHVEHSHVASREYVWNWWKEFGSNLNILDLVKF